jgi:acetyl-CoA acetyltransferase
MTMFRIEGIGDVLLIEINNPPINAGSAQTGLTRAQMAVIELNKAFAAQGLDVLRLLGQTDDDDRVKA